MSDQQTCKTCAEVNRGPEPDATADGIRAQRFLLAVLQGDKDTTARLGIETRQCPDCMTRLMSVFMAMTVSSLVQITGSNENAIEHVKQNLAKDLGDDAE